jgi:hypothetical protein
MKNFTTRNFEVRPLIDVPVGYGLRKWEVHSLVDGRSIFFQYLTDALIYAEHIPLLDNLSPEARQYWNLVAMS